MNKTKQTFRYDDGDNFSEKHKRATVVVQSFRMITSKMSVLHDIYHEVTQVKLYILNGITIYKIPKWYSNTHPQKMEKKHRKKYIHLQNNIFNIWKTLSPLHNIVLLMPGAIAVSLFCKAEGHQACGAGDGGLHFAKNTAKPPCCALLALRHIHACRNKFGQMNTTCGRSRRDRGRGARTWCSGAVASKLLDEQLSEG